MSYDYLIKHKVRSCLRAPKPNPHRVKSDTSLVNYLFDVGQMDKCRFSLFREKIKKKKNAPKRLRVVVTVALESNEKNRRYLRQ